MLAAVRALIDRISHRACIDRGRQERIDRERGDPSFGETRESLPGSTAVARFIDGVIRGDVEDIRVCRMERDRDDRLALLLAAKRDEKQDQRKELKSGLRQHDNRGGRLNHSGRIGVKDGDAPASPLISTDRE